MAVAEHAGEEGDVEVDLAYVVSMSGVSQRGRRAHG